MCLAVGPFIICIILMLIMILIIIMLKSVFLAAIGIRLILTIDGLTKDGYQGLRERTVELLHKY